MLFYQCMHSVTTEGIITSYIRNSPKLLTFYVESHHNIQPLYDDKDRLSKLKAKFSNRKLFTSGCYMSVQDYDELSNAEQFFENTELLPEHR